MIVVVPTWSHKIVLRLVQCFLIQDGRDWIASFPFVPWWDSKSSIKTLCLYKSACSTNEKNNDEINHLKIIVWDFRAHFVTYRYGILCWSSRSYLCSSNSTTLIDIPKGKENNRAGTEFIVDNNTSNSYRYNIRQIILSSVCSLYF
jgi:hypothetical protein